MNGAKCSSPLGEIVLRMGWEFWRLSKSCLVDWVESYIDEVVATLPEDLNAQVIREDDDMVVLLEADEQWSYVGSKDNPQWLWLVMHSKTRQIVAMQVGARNKETAERLFAKLPDPLKKSPLLY